MFNHLREFVPPFFLLRRLNLKENRLHQVYVGVAIRDFTAGMVGIFEPIYFYLIFDKLTSIPPLSLVAIYYALFFFSFGVISPFGARLAGKIGFRWMALLAVPFRFIYYVTLILLPKFPFLLPISFISVVAAATFYWPAFHFFFAHVSKRETRATSVSFMTISGSLAAAISPAVGGLVLMRFGYPTLFVTVLFLLIASVLPFLFSPDIKEVYRDSIFKSLRKILRRNFWRPVIAFFTSGIEDQANGILWPLFLFLIAINYSSLGFIISFSLVITLIVTYFVGILSDKKGWMEILRFGVILQFFALIMRLFVKTPFSAFVVHSFYGISRAVVSTPFFAIFYDDIAIANGESYGAVIIREQALNIGRGIFLGLCALFFLYSQNFAILFLVAAFASLFRVVVRK